MPGVFLVLLPLPPVSPPGGVALLSAGGVAPLVFPARPALLPLVLLAGGVAMGGVAAGGGVIVSMALASLPLVRLPLVLALEVLAALLLLAADLLPPHEGSAVAATRIAASLRG
jgi:hypothetical protein